MTVSLKSLLFAPDEAVRSTTCSEAGRVTVAAEPLTEITAGDDEVHVIAAPRAV
jgi:hypothetical protein